VIAMEQAFRVFTAVVRGAAHERTGLPLQDAAAYDDAGGRLAVAVADGHGSRRHFRSSRGSELAVRAGIEMAGWPALAAGRAAGLLTAVRGELVPELAVRWRRAVADDLAEYPLTGAEQAAIVPGEDFAVPYGSTLLLALVVWPRLVLCQIGDGDIIAVDPSGTACAPVPGDPLLDGRFTTSLCQPDAADAFRAVVVDLDRSPVAALLLATDGFGNAQTAEPWQPTFGADLLRLSREHGPDWVGEQLPTWVARCASAEGSGDDAAAAVVLARERPGHPATASALAGRCP
jgi:hypothetical protein